MGHSGQIDHPEVEAAILAAEKAILKSPITLGGVAFSPEQANRMVDAGYRMIILGFDWSLLPKGVAAVLQGVKRG
jgi:4-hydroxy-2-oxoheptanedioate aldolase